MSDDFNIHPAAREELHDAIRYYASVAEDHSLAIDFETTFYRYTDAIVASPLLYNIRRMSVRRANLKPRFSEYYIAYMIWRQKVVILAVAHAKRRPYYWRQRIGEAKDMF
ncbi:type II toxin-antitoxin system RelE/ParE family toxin [Prosthecobacter vanneervenii]|uniref:Plasmid stabilization system protein ParE n=1 Tax=Prosthecobacter vanneervenii TaxID=48466 RepID=A0A7W8DK77_9BACT|nr:type II toxin-antitoxin system RelE/ParE family toxin [Prosthecobacter vanneervenii]MBB5032929.1 plasmid stabilization system protein ParE [Prosthecobacter vanneervenii]